MYVHVHKYATHISMHAIYTDETVLNNFIIVGIWSDMLGGVQWW